MNISYLLSVEFNRRQDTQGDIFRSIGKCGQNDGNHKEEQSSFLRP